MAVTRTNQDRFLSSRKDWVVNHSPAANTKATITQAAPGADLRNIVTGLTVVFCATSSAPAANQITVAVIDGASGGTTYLWGPHPISIPNQAGAMNGIARSFPIPLKGTANTATTIEFSAAGGAQTIQSVEMEGTVVSDR
jgi:hypothetical protein